MSRQVPTSWQVITCAAVVLAGCQPTQPFYFFEDGDLSHYKGVATEIEHPDVEASALADAHESFSPLTLSDAGSPEIWNLSLEEAVRTALANSKVMRTVGAQIFTPGLPAANQNISPTGQVLSQAGAIPTVYLPAIVESDPRFGTEAALAAFDAQLATSIFWEKNDRPVNLFFGGFLAPVLEQDTGTYRSQLSKTTATGDRFAVRNNTSYEFSNNQANFFPSAWNTDIEAEYRHPLWQGAGAEFNRIAGPNSVPGIYNGVVIARINTDIALTDFEAGVRNLVSDVERSYWDLYFSYRNLAAVIAGRDSALETWRRVWALYQEGGRGGDAASEAQAHEQYLLFRSQVETSLSNLYTAENRLRYMMGIAATDGRLIRPSDEPTTAMVQFDWHEVLPESLARSAEIRRQKWQIKQRELQLCASRNYLLPRLDAVGRYRWRGFGDDLLSSDGRGFDASVVTTLPRDLAREANAGTGAWETLEDGDYQEWQLGLELSVPLGFRQQIAAVKNAELQLARERAILEEQELELSHQMTHAVRDLDRHYVLSQTNFNRRVAAQKQVEAVEARYESGLVTLDQLLDAQRILAEAESAYYRSLVDYNLAILQVHFRKGSLLEYNGVYLAEGPWPAKAYFDARRRARQRDAAMFLDYGFTCPPVFSRGPVPQQMGTGAQVPPLEPQPTEAPPETVPTPRPVPLDELPDEDETDRSDADATTGPAIEEPSLGDPVIDEPARQESRPFEAEPLGPPDDEAVGRWQEAALRPADHERSPDERQDMDSGPILSLGGADAPANGWKPLRR